MPQVICSNPYKSMLFIKEVKLTNESRKCGHQGDTVLI